VDMGDQDVCRRLIEAVNSAISASSDIAAALRALEFAGIEVRSLHITASLKTVSKSVQRSDSEFLRMLRIIPDLDTQDSFC